MRGRQTGRERDELLDEAPPAAGRDWFWPLWLMGLGLAVGVSLAARRGGRFPGDLALARAVQGWQSPALDLLVGVVNRLGTDTVAIAALLGACAVIALLAPRNMRLVLTLLLLPALQPLGSLLKAEVNRPRPSAALVHISEHASGLGFPSGHVFTATLLYGGIALLVRETPLPRVLRLTVQAVCLALVLLMGPARVYVGAHWPSDTLGGYLWGAVALALVLRLSQPWRTARA